MSKDLHADVIVRLAHETRGWRQGLPRYPRKIALLFDALSALTNSVSREQYDHDVAQWRRQLWLQTETTREEIERADAAEDQCKTLIDDMDGMIDQHIVMRLRDRLTTTERERDELDRIHKIHVEEDGPLVHNCSICSKNDQPV